MTLANLSRFGSALSAAPVVPDSLLLLCCGLYLGDLDALVCCYLNFQSLDYDPLSSNFWLTITICQALHSCVAWGAHTPLSERPLLPEPLLVLKYILSPLCSFVISLSVPVHMGKLCRNILPQSPAPLPARLTNFQGWNSGFRSPCCNTNPSFIIQEYIRIIRRYETLK